MKVYQKSRHTKCAKHSNILEMAGLVVYTATRSFLFFFTSKQQHTFPLQHQTSLNCDEKRSSSNIPNHPHQGDLVPLSLIHLGLTHASGSVIRHHALLGWLGAMGEIDHRAFKQNIFKLITMAKQYTRFWSL